MEELGLEHILNPNQLRKKWNYLVAKYKVMVAWNYSHSFTPSGWKFTSRTQLLQYLFSVSCVQHLCQLCSGHNYKCCWVNTNVSLTLLCFSFRSCHAPQVLMATVQPLTPGPSMTTCSRHSSRSLRTPCMEIAQQGPILRTYVSHIVFVEYCEVFGVTKKIKIDRCIVSLSTLKIYSVQFI